MTLTLVYRTDYAQPAKETLKFLKKYFEIEGIYESHVNYEAKGDIVIVVGGDGTMLRTLKTVNKPVVGIKAGRLGFFTGYTLQQIDKLVNDIKENSFIQDKRWLLNVKIGEKEFSALNDVVLQRNFEQKIVDIDVQITDGSFYYHADGVIISTPTGSSAYSLALGGPVLLPNVEAIEITPIAPQFLATRSLMVPSSEDINVFVNDPVAAIIDGDLVGYTQHVHVRKCKRTVTILRPKDYDFSRSIKDKIGYGRKILGNGNGDFLEMDIK